MGTAGSSERLPGNSTSDVILSMGAESRPTEATELLRAEAGEVRAQTVTMERAGAERVSGERVIMTNSGARTVEARSAQVDRSGVLVLRGEKAVLANSTAVAVAVAEARVVRGVACLMKAGAVTFEGEAKIGIYAGPADPAIHPLLDARGAVAFGLGTGTALALLGEVLRRIFRQGRRRAS